MLGIYALMNVMEQEILHKACFIINDIKCNDGFVN